jgi:hypothetical protein
MLPIILEQKDQQVPVIHIMFSTELKSYPFPHHCLVNIELPVLLMQLTFPYESSILLIPADLLLKELNGFTIFLDWGQ